MNSSRRTFIKSASALAAITLPIDTSAYLTSDKLKVVCTGGHPDDPESGCGGTLAVASKAGHSVTVIYLTRGEAGINGKSQDEAASIRTKEAERACAILKAKPVFAGQIDGATEFNNEWIRKFQALLENEKPDIVFTQWPIDSHPDHQVVSLLTINAWMRSKNKFELYFYEVCAGEQTVIFRPTDYVDITSIQDVKRNAIFCHVSQDPEGIYGCGHAAMEQFRGMEAGVKAAEGFVKMTGKGIFKSLL